MSGAQGQKKKNAQYFNHSPIKRQEDDRYGVAAFTEALAISLLGIKKPVGTTPISVCWSEPLQFLGLAQLGHTLQMRTPNRDVSPTSNFSAGKSDSAVETRRRRAIEQGRREQTRANK